MNKEGRVVDRIDLKPITKVWIKFLKSRLMLTTHTTTVSQDQIVLLYAIVKGLTIDVGKIIEKKFKTATRKKKLAALVFFFFYHGYM